MKISIFTFNSFGVNTYVIETSANNAIIIDAGCSDAAEEKVLMDYLNENNLVPKILINTHAHIDHILGNAAVKRNFDVKLLAHEDSKRYYEQVPSYASFFNINSPEVVLNDVNISDGEEIVIDEVKMKILYTPGHAAGSVCIYLPDEKILFSGDLLFENGVGRTDLPGGNHKVLIQSLVEKIFVLPSDVLVYPGHGSSTTVGKEKSHYPYAH